SAGWIVYDTYMPLTLRRSQNFAPAELASMYLRGIAADRVSPFLENLSNLPMRVLQGGADDNVPPTHARLLVGALGLMGSDAKLHEVPEKGHWWDIDKERPGADCVDAEELESFWRAHSEAVGWPRRVVLNTVDPDIDDEQYWVRLGEQRRVAEQSRIEAEVVDASTVRVSTRNVARFSLTLSRES